MSWKMVASCHEACAAKTSANTCVRNAGSGGVDHFVAGVAARESTTEVGREVWLQAPWKHRGHFSAEAVWLCLKHKAWLEPVSRIMRSDAGRKPRGLAFSVDGAGRRCALCLHKAAGASHVRSLAPIASDLMLEYFGATHEALRRTRCCERPTSKRRVWSLLAGHACRERRPFRSALQKVELKLSGCRCCL